MTPAESCFCCSYPPASCQYVLVSTYKYCVYLVRTCFLVRRTPGTRGLKDPVPGMEIAAQSRGYVRFL
jgi:hypothetical protein